MNNAQLCNCASHGQDASSVPFGLRHNGRCAPRAILDCSCHSPGPPRTTEQAGELRVWLSCFRHVELKSTEVVQGAEVEEEILRGSERGVEQASVDVASAEILVSWGV